MVVTLAVLAVLAVIAVLAGRLGADSRPQEPGPFDRWPFARHDG